MFLLELVNKTNINKNSFDKMLKKDFKKLYHVNLEVLEVDFFILWEGHFMNTLEVYFFWIFYSSVSVLLNDEICTCKLIIDFPLIV